MLEINLFGAPALFWESRPFQLKRRQLRAILYRLAAQMQPVPREQLAFLFWPDEPETAVRRHLTRLLSALRASLPHPQLLLITHESVSLNPALAGSDSQQFTLGIGHSDTAVLAQTLALYRGPLLAGFSLPDAPEFEAWQAGMARHFSQQHLALLQSLVGRYTAAGDYPAAIRCAQQYLAADELAEEVHRRLISLFIASGDRAAALRQFEQCTLVLERELGVSPLPETRAALSRPAQTSPAWRRPLPPVLPTLDLPLTGREEAMQALQKAYSQLRGGGIIFITGQPGMGKTRLLREFLQGQEGLVLSGSSYPGSQTLPYHPLIQALRTAMSHTNLWTAVPTSWLSELLPLLPDLRALFPSLPPPLPVPPAQAQASLLAALYQTFRAFATQTPLFLCLDDLQWADEATLTWLQFLAGQRESANMHILATLHFSQGDRLEHPVMPSLRQTLARAGRLATISLAGLTVDGVQRLLAVLPALMTSKPAMAGLAVHIQQVTGGNPFFILEILRDLQEKGQLVNPPHDLPLPPTVRDAIYARLQNLTPVARQLLETAAVLHPLLADALLQQTSGRTPAEIADALDELLTHQLMQLSVLPAASGLAFAHGLLQTAVYQAISPWRRKLLHQRAGEALVLLNPDNAAVLAHHFLQAGVVETAVTYYQQAANQAHATHAYATALDHVNQAFALLPELPDPSPVHLALLRQRLALQRVLVHLADWQADAAALLAAAQLAGETGAELEALEAQISLHVLQSDFAQVEETAGRALTLAQQAGDLAAEARIRQTLGWHLADALGRSREGLDQLLQACRLAQETGAQQVLYQALCNLAFVQRAEGQCAAARASALQALTLAGFTPKSEPHPTFADALRELGEANAYLGRWEEAWNQLRPLLTLYQTLNDPWAYGAVLYNFGLYSSNMGQHEEAIVALRRLVALSEAVGLPADSDYGIWHRAGLGRVLLGAGRVTEAGELLVNLHAQKLAPGRPYLAWARTLAEYHLVSGSAAAALAVLQPAVTWWRQAASLHDADVLLLLAQVGLALGQSELAETAVTEATYYLQPTDIARYHLRLYWTQYQIGGDPSALASARAELERQAALFSDPQLHNAFMRNVPLHRQIAEL